MSLRWYRRPRMVALRPNRPVMEAARALEKNNIGAVLVVRDGSLVGIATDRDLAVRALGHGLDPNTPISQVMTTNVITLPSNARAEDALETMRRHNIRRIPLVDDGNLVGMVTLDDLILDEQVSPDDLAEIVEAQIGEGGPAPSDRTRQAQRSASRADSTYKEFISYLQDRTGLSSPEAVETAVECVMGPILRRLTANEADDFIAQLPSLLQPRLRPYATGPDRSITYESIISDIVNRLDVDPDRAAEIFETIGFETLVSVSEGEAQEVQRQLSADIREALLTPPEF